MFSSTHKRSLATLGVVAGLLAAAVPATAAGTAGTNPAQPSGARPDAAATTQGIIMRDGGICDPIRHMGC
jgi:MFS superfamily sulfate permease-like transporter